MHFKSLKTIALIAFLITHAFTQVLGSDAWKELQKKGKGEIHVYWYTSEPFIYEDKKGKLIGIEHDLLQSFSRYLKNKYNLDLSIKWIKATNFSDCMHQVASTKHSGVLGASALSITSERLKKVDFSPPYMADISVMISSLDVPLVKNRKEFDQYFSELSAVTIKNTTYESDLLEIQSERKVPFQMEYIPSSENILRAIEQREKSFGFIDLPIYLIALNRRAELKVKRQNIFPIQREGYAYIFKKGSDWADPMEEYFQSNYFDQQLEEIIAKYIDIDVYKFLSDLFINAHDEIILLTKEKEIQAKNLKGISERVQQEVLFPNFLIAASILILVLFIIIFRLYYKRNKVVEVLQKQAQQIQEQKNDLSKQKELLEEGNTMLKKFNEDKDNLIRIMAHDLRSPANQIKGFCQIILLEHPNLEPSIKNSIQQINQTADRQNELISKILNVDAIENRRVNLVLQKVNLNHHLKELMLLYERQAKEKSITLHSKNLEGENYYIYSDPVYINQIIENLLSNAIKFTPKGKNVWVEIEREASWVHVRIKDEGPGFSLEDKKQLFKKYANHSARPTGGEQSTGLGLSIVKKYVELLDGKVTLEEDWGKGSSFLLQFKEIND